HMALRPGSSSTFERDTTERGSALVGACGTASLPPCLVRCMSIDFLYDSYCLGNALPHSAGSSMLSLKVAPPSCRSPDGGVTDGGVPVCGVPVAGTSKRTIANAATQALARARG